MVWDVSASRPALLCRSDDLHVAETDRLWIVTSRATDLARWYRLMADDPQTIQEWSAKDIEEARRIKLGPIADPLGSKQPMMPVEPNNMFFAGIDQQTRQLVAGLTVTSANGVSEIGGAVHRDYRAQGYGHETLTMACHLVHRHFGIERLVAGCEVANTASQRWLAKAGFVRTSGSRTHTLPNGRVIQPMWWEHVDPDSELRCRRPRPRRQRRLFGRKRDQSV